MSGIKRTVDEISGAEDVDDGPLPHIRRCRRASSTSPSSQLLNDEEIAANMKELSDLRLDHLPLNFMTTQFKDYLFWQSNHLLEKAKFEQVPIGDITFGDDCLPTWPGCACSMETGSLHDVIQFQLLTYDAAVRAGKLVREDIIWKSNRKMSDAKALGVELEKEAVAILYASGDSDSSGGQRSSGDVGDISSAVETPHAEATGAIDGHCSHDAADIPSSATVDVPSSDNYSSDSDSDTDTDMDDDCDDEISVNNLFDEHPYYSDYEDEPNVLHDAEVVGMPSYFSTVDLEVFVVDDDKDVDHLPEMELAVEREAFEYWFESGESIEVEVSDTQIQCTGELFDFTEQMPESMDYGVGPEVQVGYQEGGPLKGREDEEENAAEMFEETEDGFTW
ncbi:hypothetical protein FZEAL_1160 [Fusarium zealandicum]|uniref:Uncharacterized protein n=1 Tax=Fusarium zealandicum TaxID=1053134 RepID=A0A8H4UTA5_9HYPO|nr:hypothetical protein FZEAL_1160 [Fusarium zealandicum]